MLLGGRAARVLRQLLLVVVVRLGLRPLALLLLLLLGRRLVPAAVLGIQTVVPQE